MSQINLSISQLHKAYSNGELSPATLIKELTEQANQQEAVWLHVLSAQEPAPYLKALESKSLETHPLYGVPFAIKDNIDLAGIPTTAACPEFTYTPENSAFVVEQLIEAGAIPIGKTNLDQFATGLVGTRSPFGETPNAFDPDYISGGSSSGSAVATASGMVSFALGTDTAGSGRVPACFNNLVGVKPSKGLLSNTGMVPACKSIDCMSIFALDATDANKVLQVAAKYDPQDSYSRKNPPANQQPVLVKHAFSFAVPLPEQLKFFGDEGYKNEFAKAVNELQNMGALKKSSTLAHYLKLPHFFTKGLG
ncbi:amidase family protein [Pseudoalteromonas espejiana]